MTSLTKVSGSSVAMVVEWNLADDSSVTIESTVEVGVIADKSFIDHSVVRDASGEEIKVDAAFMESVTDMLIETACKAVEESS